MPALDTDNPPWRTFESQSLPEAIVRLVDALDEYILLAPIHPDGKDNANYDRHIGDCRNLLRVMRDWGVAGNLGRLLKREKK